MTNKPLQEVLYMVLVAGNFLNSVRTLTDTELGNLWFLDWSPPTAYQNTGSIMWIWSTGKIVSVLR
jgi:hypothetical protein